MKLFHFAPLSLALALTASAADLRLKAYTLDLLVWDVTVNLRSCTLRTSTPRAKPATRPLDAGKCKELGTLVNGVPKIPQKAQPPNLVHEPRYEFVIAKQRYPTAFHAPGECSVREDGELSCEEQKLSALEKMLLLLRPERNLGKRRG